MRKLPEPGPGEWKIELYETPAGQEPFEGFLKTLDPYQLVVLTTAINTILARQGHNVCATEWGKPLGKGLYEFRVRRTLETICKEAGIAVPVGAPTGGQVLLRVFFTVYGSRIVLLLGGYDKGAGSAASRQQKEIKRARTFLQAHHQAERTRRRRTK